MVNDKYGHNKFIADLCIKLPKKSHTDQLEVKINGRTQSCMLSLRAYRTMLPNIFITDGLLKPETL